MLLLVLYNVHSERELMNTIPLRLDWLWFLGYDLDSEIPNHSVLSNARSRWGVEAFPVLLRAHRVAVRASGPGGRHQALCGLEPHRGRCLQQLRGNPGRLRALPAEELPGVRGPSGGAARSHLRR